MNKEEFIKYTKELGIELTDKQINQLEIYANFLIEYNEHTNLTAIKTIDQVYLKHFYDSLTLTKVIDIKSIKNMIDIGTGAGFPGMVIKIIYPEIEITLMDSNNKKIEFLKQLSQKLSLEKINIIQARAEEFCATNRESFDLVTARAVSNLAVLSELCLPLTKLNGYFIALKGSDEQEIKEGTFAIEELGGIIEKIETFKLPFEESGRQIIKVLKNKPTKKEYPRRYDKIVKKPLKKMSK